MKNLNYAIFSAILLMGCSSPTAPPERQTSADQASGNAVTVAVVHPAQRSFTSSLLITGTAKAKEMVALHAMESGHLQEIRKDIGDVVRKNETIAVLTNPQLSAEATQAEVDVERKRVDLDKVEADLMSTKAILQEKKSLYDKLTSIADQTPALVSELEVDQANAQFISAQSGVKVGEAFISAAKSALKAAEAMHRSYQTRLALLHLKAPFAGIITKRNFDRGAIIQSGLSGNSQSAIVHIENVSTIRVVLQVPESDVANVIVGQPAKVHFPELGGVSYDAKIERIAGSLDLASKTMQTEIYLDNKDKAIKPGMYAKVDLGLANRDQSLSLPLTSLLIEDDVAWVYTVQDGIVHKKRARKGMTDTKYFEVLSDDIDGESLVIVKGKSLVKEGQNVNHQLDQ